MKFLNCIIFLIENNKKKTKFKMIILNEEIHWTFDMLDMLDNYKSNCITYKK